MQLIRHLNDEELTDLLLENDERELQPLLEALPQRLRDATERPEWFWKRQQTAIRGRIATAPGGWSRPAVTWASTMALFVLALLLLRGSPAPAPQQAHDDPDQALLVAVEEAVQTQVPASLEPAALLANEIGAGQQAQPRDVQKEKRNAD